MKPMRRPKLRMFDPLAEKGIRTLGTMAEEMGLQILSIPPPRKRKARPSGRNPDPRRTIPLNSAQWRKLRAAVLAEEPLCRVCCQPARDIDHIDSDPGNNSRANLQPLCHSCHSSKTARERAGLDAEHGCDVHGMPIGRNHSWNVAKNR